MKKRIALIGLLLVLALSSTGSVNAFVPSTGDNAVALVGEGVPLLPSGKITTNVPMFQWTSVSGATKYHVKIKKGSKVVYSLKSTVNISWVASILSNKDYKWKVRAKVGSNWQPWSAWEKFTVKDSTGFKSSFNKNANGWTERSGNWKLVKGKYVVKGPQDKYASASHTGVYSDFTYEVKFRRLYDGICWWENFILVHGTPNPLNAKNAWHQSMRFGYYDDELYYVDKYVDGAWSSLVSVFSSVVNGGGWNTFLVVAKGDTYWLFINGKFVDLITDTSHVSGVVGVGYWQQNYCSDKLKVDWAKLSTNTPW